MKVVILAGGLGTRLAEETETKPKPMVEIGGRPILWHIMKHYAHYGFNEFFVALGYKGEVIKRYFLDYTPLNGEHHGRPRRAAQVDTRTRAVPRTGLVHLVDTGDDTEHRRPRQAPAAAGCDDEHVHAHLRRRRLRTSTSARCSRSTGRTAASPRSPRCARRLASAAWSSTATSSPSSPRSRRSARAGSTAASSSSSRGIFDYLDGDDTQPRGRRARAAGRRRPARRLPARRLLAVHGHAARQAAARERCGSRARRPGRCGDERDFWRDRPTFVTGATGLVGGWLVRRLRRRRRRRRLPRPRLGARSPSCVRGGLLDAGHGRPRRRPRPGAARARRSASTRSTPSSTWRPRPSSAIANRNPVSTFETNIARHLGAARGLPPQPAGEADRRSPRPTRPTATTSSCPTTRTRRSQGRHPYDVSKSCADLIAQTYADDLRPAGRDHALRQLLRRRRPELEPHRARHDPLGAARRAAGHPLRRHVRPRLLLRRGRRGGLHAAGRAARGTTRRCAARRSTSRTRRRSRCSSSSSEILRLMESDLEPDVRNEAPNEIRAPVPERRQGARACSAGGRSSRSDEGLRAHDRLVPRLPGAAA